MTERLPQATNNLITHTEAEVADERANQQNRQVIYDLQSKLLEAELRIEKLQQEKAVLEKALYPITRLDPVKKQPALSMEGGSDGHLRALIENLSDIIMVTDASTRIYFVSPSVQRTMGYLPEELTGTNGFDLVHPGDQGKMLEHFAFLLNGETRAMSVELRVLHKDGSWRTLEVMGRSQKDETGRVSAVLTLHDINERKRAEEEVQRLNALLEQRVQERTAQLENANRELEAFAYSVSHDLRAPLRSIDGFSQALQQEFAPVLDARGMHYLDNVRAAAQRMSLLIEDLLRLSRATRGDMDFARVDLSAIAKAQAEALQAADPERRVEWAITPGLNVDGDARLLENMLENLLSNAWKFTSRHLSARIEVGSLDEEGQKVYYVRDDGAGFDMSYSNKLFNVFQRLHSFDEFTGTGIGLATVKRIIQRHGGKVWAVGEIDKGATFFFTLPDHQGEQGIGTN